jgi:hypothetical protein
LQAGWNVHLFPGASKAAYACHLQAVSLHRTTQCPQSHLTFALAIVQALDTLKANLPINSSSSEAQSSNAAAIAARCAAYRAQPWPLAQRCGKQTGYC